MQHRTLVSLLALTIVYSLGPISRAAPGPRQQERFDAGWRFHRGDVPGAERPGYQDGGWRRVDLPHDYSIEDLPPVSTSQKPALPITRGQWKFQLGDDPAWKAPDFDDSSWQNVELPTHWSKHVPGDIAGKFGWYRRRFSIPPAMRGKDIVLLLGKVDDADETFVNGIKVGGLGSFPPKYVTAYAITRRYPVPARLLKGDGTDVIAVRDYNGAGDAGIYEAAAPPHRSGPFDAESVGGSGQGFTVGGVGWYRKTFVLPAAARGRRLSILFDGVYMNAQSWLNGHSLGTHPYGYTSYSCDLTPYVRAGAPNVLAVRVDTSGQTSRWYSGSGIYRHVWLTATAPVHIGQWGVYITTPRVSAAEAAVRIRTTVEGLPGEGHGASLKSRIVDDRGRTVAITTAGGPFSGPGTKVLDQRLTVVRPHLWSTAAPTLYRLVSTVMVGGRVVDQVQTPFGIRAISFDAARGFLLNGVPLKLRGGCVHHDNGPLGSCTYDRAEARRVQLLKAAGFNAIRTSHNPPSPAFLDACDRQGVLVLDEAFDCWKYGKNPQDYGIYFSRWWKRDIDSMVQRDRDHPSVILWSIGNEIPEQTSQEGADRGAMLAAEVRAQDPTRPVTEATNPNGDKLDPLLAHLDVVGYNYQAGRFAADEGKHPGRVFAQTESFPADCFNSWMTALDHPYVVGDFVWTALDYSGEAGIGRAIYPGDGGGFAGEYPWTVSGCGDLDMDGVRKPQSYYRGVVWNRGPKVVAFVDAVAEGQPGYHISGWGWPDERASWTWPGTEGKSRTVRVYANTPKVRLLLNGHNLGEKDTTRATHDTATYAVPYAPGTLVAVGLDANGKETARWTLRTTGKATSLRLTPDRKTITADGEDLSYVAVDLTDQSGLRDPNASNLVHFTLTGPGKIAGVGNGDPYSDESFQQPHRHAFQGRCLVIIKSEARGGDIHLRATAAGIKNAATVIRSSPALH